MDRNSSLVAQNSFRTSSKIIVPQIIAVIKYRQQIVPRKEMDVLERQAHSPNKLYWQFLEFTKITFSGILKWGWELSGTQLGDRLQPVL